MNGGPTKTVREKTRRRKEAGKTVPTAFPASFIPWGATPFTPDGAG